MNAEPATTVTRTHSSSTPGKGDLGPSLVVAHALGVILGFSGTGSAATAVALPEMAANVGFDPDIGGSGCSPAMP